MEQELVKRIIVALYKRLCAGRLLVIVPALPWGTRSLEKLLQCLAHFGWQADISAAPGVQISKALSAKLLAQESPVDLSRYQRIWVPALPLDVMGRLKNMEPGNRQETMILEALLGNIPLGIAEGSWIPPEIRESLDTGGLGSNLQRGITEITEVLGSWGIHWVPEEDSGSWILGAQTQIHETNWQESVLHGSAVRMLGPGIRTLRVHKGTVVTAAARDELARLQIRLVGDR